MQEKTEGEIQNGTFTECCNIGNTRHRTKTNKANHTTQKTPKMSNKVPPKNRGVPEALAVLAPLVVPVVLLLNDTNIM